MPTPRKKAAAKKAPAKAAAAPLTTTTETTTTETVTEEVEVTATVKTTMSINPFVVLAEKVIATYIQVFMSLLVVGTTIDVSMAQVAAVAAVPAALTVMANGIPVIPIGLPFYVDLVMRTVRTYAVSFLGLLIAQPVFHLDRSAGMAAAVGALPTALAVLKGALASKVGLADSAALLPKRLDMPASVNA